MAGLAEREARHQAILELAVDGIITIDTAGNIESFNRAAERIFGYSASEVIGQPVHVLMPEPYRSQHDGYIRHYQNTGERRIIGIGREVVGRRKDGTTFPVDLAVSEVQIPSGLIYTGIIRDLTERRRVENLAEVGRIASGLAHEIGTPMNIILGYAERLRLRASDPRIADGLGVIIEQVERVSRLMDSLLSYARRPPLLRRPMTLEPVIRSVVAVLGDRVRERGITVRVDVDPATPVVEADKDRMEQVVLNLAVNAIDAMSAGGVLSIVTAAIPDPRRAELRVIDTGSGIPSDHLPTIFEPFVTTKPTGKGTGLGLSVVRSVVREHGGSIRVETQVGMGTTFIIEFPARELSG